MKGKANMSGVTEQGLYEVLPEGTYTFDIQEATGKTSNNGDPLINIKLVVAEGEFKGKFVWDNILIPSPDSPAAKILGRTKHFLHCIGQPFEGDIEWDSDDWGWQKVQARVTHEAPNQYHSYVKAVIAEYILSEELAKEDSPF